MVLMPGQPDAAETKAEAAVLEARYGGLEPARIIELAVGRLFAGEIGAVSSFGADSAVLLHLISRVDRSLPVAFLETGKHFEETIGYRDALVSDLGLTGLRIVEPRAKSLSESDPAGDLHKTDTDGCCAVRKVEPMARTVEPWRAWFTGRKRFQSATRAKLPVFEAVGSRVRINPLAGWDARDIQAYATVHGLRENPLVAYGYLSIGCFPCTQPVKPGDDPRAGRWSGSAKTECGIHLGGLEQSLASSSL